MNDAAARRAVREAGLKSRYAMAGKSLGRTGMAEHVTTFQTALDALDALIAEEQAEREPSPNLALSDLDRARSALIDFQRHEGSERDSDTQASAHLVLTRKSGGALIRKSIPAGAPVATEPTGRIRAVVNSTNVIDLQQDNVRPGAWQRVIKSGKLPKLLLSHDHTALPVGKVIALDEWMPGDARLPPWHLTNGAGALVMDAQVDMNREAGRDFFSAVAGGYLDQYSVAFLTAPKGEHYDNKAVRNVTDIELFPEVSGVLVGASPMTGTLVTKSAKSGKSAATQELSWFDALELLDPDEIQRLVEDLVAQELWRLAN